MDILPVAVGDEPAVRAWHDVVLAASPVDSLLSGRTEPWAELWPRLRSLDVGP